MARPHTGLSSRNKFKVGLFAMNCSNGLCMTTAPERWVASWDNNVLAAQLADEAGVDFLLPIGRWHGYKGVTDTQGETFETLTWAAGLLAVTKRASVCGTLHVRFLNPIFAAKQIVTADHIGKGRFALNIVSGWNHGEFDMFGVDLIPHETRYDYTEEWVNIVKRVWSEDEPFDFDGEWHKLKGVLGKPKPWGNEFPMLISAGSSTEGRGFAARHVDCLFTSVQKMDVVADNIASVRAMATEAGKQVQVFASGHTIARPTRKEAEDYYNYVVIEKGDWAAAEHAAAIRLKGRESRYDQIEELKQRLVSGLGTCPLIGSYDDVDNKIRQLSEAGLDGMALGMVNYILEMPHLRDGVFPRLERLGLRVPARDMAET
ncbi:MAG: LLM class flavin-dependent oxidoreductase [Burkholderiales bacterium]